jgi:phenylacetate-CoA ligase
VSATGPGPYFAAFDAPALLRQFPVGEDFIRHFRQLSRDELHARQDRDFQRLLQRAWQIPFYQKLYAAAGIEPGDIRALEDISKLPVFGKTELMASIERNPPLGDFHGSDSAAEPTPMVLHTTSGTTGHPQVLLFGPRSREIQNLLLARIYLLQGLQPDDIVHLVYGFGMINGGHYVREAILHWTRALLLTAGTGNETPSRQQVELMRRFKATCIVGFADYIKRLADVARENGIEPGRDIPVRMISGHLGREDRQALEQSWGGCRAYDWYGVGDTGIIAGEGPDRDGLYVLEDAHYLEILDVDSAQAVTDGASGDMVVTVLFKDDIYPIIRFNTHDVSAFRTDSSVLDLNLRRIEGVLGRSDNLDKVKGINIVPQALGPLLAERAEFGGEFILRARRDAHGLDQLTIIVEVAAGDAAALEPVYRELLKQKLGIDVAVEFVQPGQLAALTGIESRQKPIRLLDER